MSGGSLADQIAKLKSSGVPADKIDEYKAAFALFDTDGSGVISEAPSRRQAAADAAAAAAAAARLATSRPPLARARRRADAAKLAALLNEGFGQAYADDDLAYMLQVRHGAAACCCSCRGRRHCVHR